MKKFVILIAFVSILCLLFYFNQKNEPFALEEKYYQNKIEEIQTDTLNTLLENNESFVLQVYQPMCITSSNLEKVIQNFEENNSLYIYKITFSSLKKTPLEKVISYYPSFVVIKNGKVVDYLKANKTEDIIYYEEEEAFENWLSRYIIIKKN